MPLANSMFKPIQVNSLKWALVGILRPFDELGVKHLPVYHCHGYCHIFVITKNKEKPNTG